MKNLIKAVLGFLKYHFLPKRRFVIILSAVRSGSTLLKALVSEAPEIEHINEHKFRTNGNKYIDYFNLSRAAKGSIVLLKQPAQFNVKNRKYLTYPQLPNLDIRTLILYRNPVETAASTEKMAKIKGKDFSLDDFIHYWTTTYDNLHRTQSDISMIVKYDQLVERPKEITAEIFAFIGSTRKDGVDSYSKPKSGSWEWGRDDGSDNIKSQKVMKTERAEERIDQIASIFRDSKEVQATLARYQENIG